MKGNNINSTKRQLLAALAAGNMDKVRKLRNKIRFAEEMPFFIVYEVKDGLYHLDWKDMKMTSEQFEQLKKDCPQLVYWEEVKTYAE